MSKIKFPPLHKVVGKDLETAGSYIHIINDHAVLFDGSFTMVVDLKTYFYHKKNSDADPDYDYENVMDVLYYLDRKHVSSDFWAELVSAPFVMLSDDESHLIIKSRGTTKELYYTEPKDVDVDEIKTRINENIKALMKISKKETLPVNCANFNYPTIRKAFDVLGIKNDNVVMEFFGHNERIRFTMGDTPYVFGSIANPMHFNDKLFKTESFENFFEALKDIEPRETVKMIRERKEIEIKSQNKEVVEKLQELDIEFETVEND